MRDEKGRFIKGSNIGKEYRFKKETHWRKEQVWWNREWLYKQYITDFHSANEIAKNCNTTEKNILYWLRKHNIQCRSMAEIRKEKYWGLMGSANPMWGKCGILNCNWMGGITPERQAFYISQEWKKACSAVWKRDNAHCQRCGLNRKNIKLHVHHIESFANKKLRAEVDNLILLCKDCHSFVHSKKNTKREYLPKK